MSQKDIRIVASRLRPQATNKPSYVEQVRTACNINTGPKQQIKQLPVAPVVGAGNGILPGAVWYDKANPKMEIIILSQTPTLLINIAEVDPLTKDQLSTVKVITQKGLQEKYSLKP